MNGYLGIDVSKGFADFTLLTQNKNPLEENFQLDDVREGHEALKKFLQKSIKKHHLQQVFCGMESTGGFENNWYASLIKMSAEMPLKVARINPSGIKHNVRAGLRRNVTDALSSAYIAEYMIALPDRINWEQQNSYYASFRCLHKNILLLKKQRTQLINTIKMTLYSAFPDILRFCKQGVPNWALELLQKYPTASRLALAQPKDVAIIRGITLQKAEQMVEKAQVSVASRDNEAVELVVRDVAEQIRDKQRRIEKYKNHLVQTCKGKEIELLTSIKGVGDYTAAAMMIEIEDIRRFPSPEHLASYFGLHPELKESGDKTMSCMSKKGRSSMRGILYMAAKSAVRSDPHFKAIYNRLRRNGKSYNSAMGAIMHKLLRVAWGVLASGKPYDARIDGKYQERTLKAIEKSKLSEVKSKRRFQTFSKDAPVSRIQDKKRKALIDAQVPQNGEQARAIQQAPVSTA